MIPVAPNMLKPSSAPPFVGGNGERGCLRAWPHRGLYHSYRYDKLEQSGSYYYQDGDLTRSLNIANRSPGRRRPPPPTSPFFATPASSAQHDGFGPYYFHYRHPLRSFKSSLTLSRKPPSRASRPRDRRHQHHQHHHHHHHHRHNYYRDFPSPLRSSDDDDDEDDEINNHCVGSSRGLSTSGRFSPPARRGAVRSYQPTDVPLTNDRFGFLTSVHVVPKTGGGGGYHVYRDRDLVQTDKQGTRSGNAIGNNRRIADEKSNNKRAFLSSSDRGGRSSASGRNRPEFTQSLSVDGGTRFSRNIGNPALREKQKARLELATSRLEALRNSETLPQNFGSDSPDSRLRHSSNSRPDSSNKRPLQQANFENTAASRQRDLAFKTETVITESIEDEKIQSGKSGFLGRLGSKSQPSSSSSRSSRGFILFRPFTSRKKKDLQRENIHANNNNNNNDDALRAASSTSSLASRESESRTNSRITSPADSSHSASTSTGTVTDMGPDLRDFECSCALYHCHHLTGTPVNSFLAEVKEKRLEQLTTSMRLAEESRVDGVEDLRNVLWVPTLSFHPYVHGEPKLEFGDLWPNHRKLRELLQNPGIQQQVLRNDAVLALCTLSVTCGPIHLLQCLVEIGLIRVDQQTRCGSGLLHLAVLSRNVQSVKYLMTAKVSPKLRDANGLTADKVCYSSTIRKQLQPRYIQSRDMTKEKILPKPSLQEKDTIFKQATSPQFFADIQKKLQSFDFNVNTECDNNGDFLLHIACRSGLRQLPLLMALVKIQGADIELCNVNGMTPLMMGALEGNCVLCDVLICLFGADPNKTNSSTGKSALHYAAEGNHRKTVEGLIRRGADVNIEDFEGLRPDDIPNFCNDIDDCSEVILFHRNKRLEMLSDIVKKGQVAASQLFPTDLCVVDSDKHTLVMMAAIYNRSDTLDTLLSVSTATINAQHSRTGMTALAIAAQMGNSSAVRALLRHEANPAIADMKGFLPLHHAVLNNHELTVETCLNFFPQTYLGLFQACRLCKRTSIHTLLTQAWEKRQEEIVTPKILSCAINGDAEELFLLLDEGDNINPRSGTGNWPLYVAVENGHLDVLKLIVERGGNLIKRHPTTGATALHLAASTGQESIVSYLLQFCSDAASNKSKRMAAAAMASIPNPTIPNFLLASFLGSSLRSSGHSSQGSSESSKSTGSHGGGRKVLHINAVDADNKTALQVAAEKGYSRIVEMLLQQGASTAILDAEGSLVTCTQYEGVRIMIDTHRHQHTREVFGCIMDKSRNMRKSLAMLEAIWLPKFDHHLRNKEGSTPLMVACQLGRIPVVKFLLQSAVYTNLEADVYQDDLDSDTDSGVLDPCTGGSSRLKDDFNMSQSIDMTDLQDAYSRPCNGEGQEEEDSNPFFSDSSELFHHRLIDKFVTDTNTSNRPKGLKIYQSGMTSHVCAVNLLDGTTALHQSLIGGGKYAHQILSLLLEADASSLNTRNDKGETALHLACQLNLKKCVELLLAHRDIDPNVRTLNGRLPEEFSENESGNRNVNKTIQKMVEKAREAAPVPVNSTNALSPTVTNSNSPAHSVRSHSVSASTINFDKVHDRYEEMKRDKIAKVYKSPDCS